MIKICCDSTIKEDEKKQLEEILLMEDKVYDFFNKKGINVEKEEYYMSMSLLEIPNKAEKYLGELNKYLSTFNKEWAYDYY